MTGFTTFEIEQGALTVTVDVQEAVNFSQEYSSLSGASVTRFMNGAAYKQCQWQKLSTRISCSGPLPTGINEVDFKISYKLKCGAKRAVSKASPNIDIPAARRSDAGFTPKGFGFVPDDEGFGAGEWVESPGTLVGDQLQITPVAGATKYRAYYWPEFFVFSEPPEETTDVQGGESSWTLTAEEI